MDQLTATVVQVGFGSFDAFYAGPRRPMRELALGVCVRAGLTLRQLRGPRKTRDHAWPRQDFMRLASDEGFSSTQIGMFLSHRDHTTVLYGIKKSNERRKAKK